MIKKIGIFLCTILLFTSLTWTTVAATPTADTQQQILQTPVAYELPYPGLLPDSFFYPLKTFRDKVVSFLITDPQKKASFDLLQADKRLAAGEYLLAEKQPNTQLISQTISKGENYFQEAIQSAAVAQKQGMVIDELLNTLVQAGMKHEQVLFQMSFSTQGQLKQSLLQDIVRVQGFVNQVNNMKLHQ